VRTQGKEKESYPVRNATHQIEEEACTSTIAMHQIWIDIWTRTFYKRAGQCIPTSNILQPIETALWNPSTWPRVARRKSMHGRAMQQHAGRDTEVGYVWLRYQLSVPLTISYKDHTQADSVSLSVTNICCKCHDLSVSVKIGMGILCFPDCWNNWTEYILCFYRLNIFMQRN
jgi:hypothetical protein